MTLSGTDWIADVDLVDGQFFTFATVAANLPPIAVNDTQTGAEDTPNTINVITNDTDVDSTADTISISGATLTGATKGTLALSGTTSVTYTPNANTCGTDSYTYQAYDGVFTSTGTATVSVTITCLNDAPTSTGVIQTINEDTQFAFTGGAFPYADVDSGTVIASGKTLGSVKIVSLPSV